MRTSFVPVTPGSSSDLRSGDWGLKYGPSVWAGVGSSSSLQAGVGASAWAGAGTAAVGAAWAGAGGAGGTVGWTGAARVGGGVGCAGAGLGAAGAAAGPPHATMRSGSGSAAQTRRNARRVSAGCFGFRSCSCSIVVLRSLRIGAGSGARLFGSLAGRREV